MSDELFDFAVIGGGYSGLSVTIKLIDRGFRVILIEKSNFLGGLGQTVKLSNGTKCESFYHHFFTHDDELIKFTNRFLNYTPKFNETSMSIFYKGKTHSWNGVLDLIKYPHIDLIGKCRFIFATLILSKGILPNKFLDRFSLPYGLKRLYGKKAFESIWEPMIEGKFGNKSKIIPLRWMKGRLKQRIESRETGKEKLGFIEGSLFRLTESIKKFILKKESKIQFNSRNLDIKRTYNNTKYSISFQGKNPNEFDKILVDNIVFTTSGKVANSFLKNFNFKQKWDEHKYFTAYCVLIELNQSLSNFYWTNIADKNLFFCGYIEQTRLTNIKEYNGISLAYLTKYIYLENKKEVLSKKELKKLALFALKNLFPKKDIDKILIKTHVSISHNAQVITDFNFKGSDMDLLKRKNIYLGNMSNVYPNERSINNAIKVGSDLSKKIN